MLLVIEKRLEEEISAVDTGLSVPLSGQPP
jgi:hypothetical protein